MIAVICVELSFTDDPRRLKARRLTGSGLPSYASAVPCSPPGRGRTTPAHC